MCCRYICLLLLLAPLLFLLWVFTYVLMTYGGGGSRLQEDNDKQLALSPSTSMCVLGTELRPPDYSAGSFLAAPTEFYFYVGR